MSPPPSNNRTVISSSSKERTHTGFIHNHHYKSSRDRKIKKEHNVSVRLWVTPLEMRYLWCCSRLLIKVPTCVLLQWWKLILSIIVNSHSLSHHLCGSPYRLMSHTCILFPVPSGGGCISDPPAAQRCVLLWRHPPAVPGIQGCRAGERQQHPASGSAASNWRHPQRGSPRAAHDNGLWLVMQWQSRLDHHLTNYHAAS